MNEIYRLRKKAKLSQEELASAIGVTRLTIIKMEDGGKAKQENLEALASFFNVTVDEVLGKQPRAVPLNGNIYKDGTVMPRETTQLQHIKAPFGMKPEGLEAYELMEDIDPILYRKGYIFYVKLIEIGEDPTAEYSIIETTKGKYFGKLIATDKAGYFDIKPLGSRKLVEGQKVVRVCKFAGLIATE